MAPHGPGSSGRPGLPPGPPRARSAGRGGWRCTRRSSGRWPPGNCHRRGRGPSASGPTGCPEDRRNDADEILVAAARGGADLAALAGLAQEMYERCGAPDAEDGFEDRWFRLGITFRGAGRAEGDLTPGCAAALAAVLEALGKKAGPEDVRTGAQRRHDALEEACRRLIRAGMVPGRAGQPTQVLVHLTLAQLRGLPGASAAEDAWAAARAAQPGWLTGPDADAGACDATVVPVVTGHVDGAALDQFTDAFLLARAILGPPRRAAGPPRSRAGLASSAADWASRRRPVHATGGPGSGPAQRPPASRRQPAGSPAGRRRAQPAARSLARTPARHRPPRRSARHPRPAAPGAARPGRRHPVRPRTASPPGCAPSSTAAADLGQPAAGHRRRHRNHPRPPAPRRHHPPPALRLPRLRPARQRLRHPPHHPPLPRRPHQPCPTWSPLCTFHHQIAVHRWGWNLALNTDGTTTATSPDGQRTLHSHSPPGHDPPSQAA